MRLGGALQAAAQILAAAPPAGKGLAGVLKDWGAAHRFAGAKDRAFIAALCYDAMRRRLSLQHKIGGNAPQDLAYAAYLAGSGSSVAAMEQKLAGDKFAPPPLEPAQKQAWHNADISQAADFIQADIPEWCAASFARSFGSEWVAEGCGLAERPPLDLRVNSLKADRPAVKAALASYGARPFALSPGALRIAAASDSEPARRPNLPAEAAFQQGKFEIQDCGSQLAAKLCAAKPHEQILDYCAGGGGKTLALAADMVNSGQIYAHDAEQRRLAPIGARLARAGVRNAQIIMQAQGLKALESRMDCVVLDAPCSGAGTWRRHPEDKWLLTPEVLAQRLAQQRQVLAAGARYVRPGGRLVYITCSVLHEENDAQIEQFLAENRAFRQSDMRALWAQQIAAPAEKAATKTAISAGEEQKLSPHFTAFGLLMSPRATQTDGFFVSVLEKVAD